MWFSRWIFTPLKVMTVEVCVPSSGLHLRNLEIYYILKTELDWQKDRENKLLLVYIYSSGSKLTLGDTDYTIHDKSEKKTFDLCQNNVTEFINTIYIIIMFPLLPQLYIL